MTTDEPDKIVMLKAAQCQHFRCDQADMPVIRIEKAQVIDLPEWKSTVKEYRCEATVLKALTEMEQNILPYETII